jgi:hypothetical protein
MHEFVCCWCKKPIESIDDSSLKNGKFIHNVCLKENIECNNQMMKKVKEIVQQGR